MEFAQISEVLRRVLSVSESLVLSGRRAEIRNERYFHHMFSCFAAQHLWSAPHEAWSDLALNPEWPTSRPFRFKHGLNVYDHAATARDAVGRGTSGQIDFMLRPVRETEASFIEWKGPKIFTERGIAEVMLKLLTEPTPSVKVVAAIFTSATMRRADHRRTIVERFNRFGIEFATNTLREMGQEVDLASANVFACLATIPDSGVEEIHWGPVTGPLS